MKYLKTFEALYEGETFYKLVSREEWRQIEESGTILPLGTVKRSFSRVSLNHRQGPVLPEPIAEGHRALAR